MIRVCAPSRGVFTSLLSLGIDIVIVVALNPDRESSLSQRELRFCPSSVSVMGMTIGVVVRGWDGMGDPI